MTSEKKEFDSIGRRECDRCNANIKEDYFSVNNKVDRIESVGIKIVGAMGTALLMILVGVIVNILILASRPDSETIAKEIVKLINK